VTSPMSVGTWLLATEGTATGVAAGCELLDILPRLRAGALAVSGLLGPPTATYTGALIADSVVPVWHEARHELPVVFASSAAAAAGGVAAALTPAAYARPARRLGAIGGIAEVVVQKLMEKRLGELVAEPYTKGEGGRYAKAAQAAMLAGTATMLLAGRSRAGAVVAGGLLAAGSWCGRFSAFHAGKTSAVDPTYTSIPQRARAAERGEPAIAR
jgi:hypothetical protein